MPGCVTPTSVVAFSVTVTVTVAPTGTSNSVGASDSHGTSVAPHWSSSDSFSDSGVGLNPPDEPPTL